MIVIKLQNTLFFTKKNDKTKINGTDKKNIKVFENKGKLGITANIGKLGERTKFEMRTQNKHINGLICRWLKSPAYPYLRTVMGKNNKAS